MGNPDRKKRTWKEKIFHCAPVQRNALPEHNVEHTGSLAPTCCPSTLRTMSTTRPRASMKAEIPLFVTRTMGSPTAAAVNCARRRRWTGALDSLKRSVLISTKTKSAPSPALPRTRSGKMSSKQISAPKETPDCSRNSVGRVPGAKVSGPPRSRISLFPVSRERDCGPELSEYIGVIGGKFEGQLDFSFREVELMIVEIPKGGSAMGQSDHLGRAESPLMASCLISSLSIRPTLEHASFLGFLHSDLRELADLGVDVLRGWRGRLHRPHHSARGDVGKDHARPVGVVDSRTANRSRSADAASDDGSAAPADRCTDPDANSRA